MRMIWGLHQLVRMVFGKPKQFSNAEVCWLCIMLCLNLIRRDAQSRDFPNLKFLTELLKENYYCPDNVYNLTEAR